jgi:hypothetical protein
MVLKPVAFVALVRKAADKTLRNNISLKSFVLKDINEVVVTRNKTNNFVGVVTSGFEPDVAHEPPVGSRWCKEPSTGEEDMEF